MEGLWGNMDPSLLEQGRRQGGARGGFKPPKFWELYYTVLIAPKYFTGTDIGVGLRGGVGDWG